jgi:hypothetical protein
VYAIPSFGDDMKQLKIKKILKVIPKIVNHFDDAKEIELVALLLLLLLFHLTKHELNLSKEETEHYYNKIRMMILSIFSLDKPLNTAFFLKIIEQITFNSISNLIIKSSFKILKRLI